jgi:ankyrin repeat protein
VQKNGRFNEPPFACHTPTTKNLQNEKIEMSDARSLLDKAKSTNIDAIKQLEILTNLDTPDLIAINNLGVCYEFGYSVVRDESKAITLYRRAADLGDDAAMCNLGLANQAGRGTPINIVTAAYWYLESAKRKTTNPNGSPRAIDQLEKLVREASPHREAIISLAICYEEGYVVTKNSHRATELFAKVGMHSLAQNNIRKKLACYLRSKSRNPEVIRIFENKGHCLGFTFLPLYTRWLQNQPARLGGDGKPIPTDTQEWLLNVLNRVANWDGVSPLSKEDENQFERLTSLLIGHQAGWYNLPIKQGDFHDYIVDSRGRKINQEYSIASRLTQHELEERLPLIAHEGKLVLLLSNDHYVGFIKLGELFYFIDPENPKGLISVSNIDELCKLIFSACFYNASIPSPFALSIFGVSDSKLESKDGLVELKYPSQETLLKDLQIFDPKYRFPASQTYASGYTDLHRACWIGCTPSIRFILEKNKGNSDYLNKKETHGLTALMMAATNGQLDATEQLIDAGADKDLVNNDQHSAVVLAAMNGFTNVVIKLLEKGAKQKDLALTVSAREGHTDIISTLLESKANVNHRASDGWTALTLAAKNNHPNVVRLLLRNGADVNLPGQNGLTALDIAMQSGNTLIVKILASYLLDVYEKKLDERKEDHKPRLPLFSFISKGHSKATKKAAVADAREALLHERPISPQYIAVLNNSILKKATTALRNYQPIKLKLGL